MVELKLQTKKLGNSVGLILPSKIVQKEGIKPNQEIKIMIINSNPLRETFGRLKGKIKQSSQEMKDEFRETLYN